MTYEDTQRGKILAYLQSGFEISAYEAFYRFGCLRLAARIEELRRLGHSIETVRQKTANGANYAVYRINDGTAKP